MAIQDILRVLGYIAAIVFVAGLGWMIFTMLTEERRWEDPCDPNRSLSEKERFA